MIRHERDSRVGALLALGFNQSQTARIIGVSRERVRQLIWRFDRDTRIENEIRRIKQKRQDEYLTERFNNYLSR